MPQTGVYEMYTGGYVEENFISVDPALVMELTFYEPEPSDDDDDEEEDDMTTTTATTTSFRITSEGGYYVPITQPEN